jgi:hypothetical protein
MPNLFARVAAWFARQLFPPAGRHSQRPLPRTALAPIAVSPPARSALRVEQAAPRKSFIRAEETALVRPYVLAAERRHRCGRGYGPGLAATL